jgi:O-antigen ligase
VGALYVFAASLRVSTTLAILALGAMLLAFVAVALGERRAMTHEALVWLGIGTVSYLAVRTWWAATAQPDAATAHIGDALALAQLWVFVVAGWWMRGSPRRAMAVLALALASFAIGSIRHVHGEDLLMLLTAERQRELLGLPTNAYALYAATALVGVMLLARRMWGGPGSPVRGARMLAWLLALAFFAQAVIAAQSRATWIACLLAFPPLLWLGARAWLRGPRTAPRGEAVTLAAGAAVLSALIALNAGTIAQRIGTDTQTLAGIARGDTAAVPADRHSSYGVRFHLQEMGLQRWRERLWLGWGPGATPLLIRELPRTELHRYRHVHNSYLELLLRLGVVGLVPFLVAALLVGMRLRRAQRRGAVPRDLALFVYGALTLLAVWSLFDFRMISTDWRFFWIVVMGVAAGLGMARQTGDRTAEPAAVAGGG